MHFETTKSEEVGIFAGSFRGLEEMGMEMGKEVRQLEGIYRDFLGVKSGFMHFGCY